ncbi:tripartite tricarboxylate transporter substrate binding protein [Achromobacter sp. F4_2707]|uniref:Bug family tripartite tricarboxylate transporter substrate binding protein n=1 Tax=Achromobacter sp. F4_2707 TaxID=3114286 RepID=UPI0039C66E62
MHDGDDDYANQNKGKLNYASVGMGNPLHLATEMLNERLGIDVLHVPFNGSAPALTSLMAKETQMMVDGVITSLPLIQGGKLNALAVMSSERLDVMPDVPTVAEQGNPGFHAATWFGIATPAKTPEEVVNTLHKALGEVISDPEFIKNFSALGMVVQAPRTLEETAKYVERDQATWKQVITDNDFQLD